MQNPLGRLFHGHTRDTSSIRLLGNKPPAEHFRNEIRRNLTLKNDMYTFQDYRFYLDDSDTSVIAPEKDKYKATTRHIYIVFLDIGNPNNDILKDPCIAQLIQLQPHSAFVWCSYGWEQAVSFESRMSELKLRTETLNPSLRAGATYVRCQQNNWESYRSVLVASFERETKLPPRETVSKESVFESSKSWKAVTAREEELLESDIIIALMGPTGAGKSTLIHTLTGADIDIGHDLESCTSDISAFRIKIRNPDPPHNTHHLVIIDTPGFDDTNKSDLEIFKLLSAFLERTFLNQITLSGLIYLHRISDNRMAGTPLRNLRMFQSLCGKDAFNKIVLATSMWDDVDEEEGSHRESLLMKDYWSGMINKGSKVSRFRGTRESAVHILLPIIARAEDVGPLRLQQELAESYKELSQTDAGKQMYTKLESLLDQQRHAMDQLKRDVAKEVTPRYREILQKELDDLSKQIQVVVVDMQYLKYPVPRLFSRFLRLVGRD